MFWYTGAAVVSTKKRIKKNSDVALFIFICIQKQCVTECEREFKEHKLGNIHTHIYSHPNSETN